MFFFVVEVTYNISVEKSIPLELGNETDGRDE